MKKTWLGSRWCARGRLGFLLGGLAVLAEATPASAYPHVVQKGQTLAQIAERAYGLVEMERVLVAANGLDACGGVPIATGMRLEIPALPHHRVQAGETWTTLATTLLGDEHRQVVLSGANGSSPWMIPAEGSEVVVPYNLRVTVGPSDTLVTIAQRFLGAKDKAWVLDHYNRFNGNAPHRGDLVLVPITNLKLTPEGHLDAQAAGGAERATGGGAREAQRRVDADFPGLLADVRSGRYVDAVTKGARMLTYGDLSKPQLAAIHRQLLEAYVALGADGLGGASCRAWRENDPAAVLDPVRLSPKLIAACDGTRR